MKRRWLLPLAAAGMAVLLLRGGGTNEPEWLLRYAENQPEDYPTTQSAYYFAELVSERTDGAVKITVCADGVLGNESAVIRQVQFGGIDLARVSIAQLVTHAGELSVLTMPYLYRDNRHMWEVLDGEIGDRFLDGLASIGLEGLSWYDAGVRNFYTRERITTLDDLRGMVIRVQETDYMSDVVRALGAAPKSIPYNEVYSSLLPARWTARKTTGPATRPPSITGLHPICCWTGMSASRKCRSCLPKPRRHCRMNTWKSYASARGNRRCTNGSSGPNASRNPGRNACRAALRKPC